MNMIKKLSRIAALCAFLSISSVALADDLQDANKLLKLGQHAQAMEKVNAVLASKPKNAQARFLKGVIQTEQGNTADAIATFTALTDDYPELPEPYNNLAVLYASQGEYEKAKSELEMAIRTHPNYPTAHENLGDIYAKMASQAYERALQLDKNNPGTQAKLTTIRSLFSSNTKTARTHAAPATGAAADILKATQEWAAAWSAKDSDKFLAFYSVGFKPPKGATRSTWEAQRKKSIAAPKTIKVEIQDAKITLTDADHASVSFHQLYRTSQLNSNIAKTLVWVKANGQWLIAEEHVDK